MKYNLLFLCTGNSCRSQMAEGWTRHLWPNLFEVSSAGLTEQGLNQNAVKVMMEKNIDISHHVSKTLKNLPTLSFDFVVTVCDHADDFSPTFSGKTKKIHHGFDDPPKLAESAKTGAEALAHYRRVRDEIGDFIKTLPELLQIKTLLV